jgi:hypothetical protein
MDGFEEVEAAMILCTLRHAGLCVKSVGLRSGLVSGRHGVRVLPDLTLAEADQWAKGMARSVAILPEGEQVLSQLEMDPRVHRLLRQVVMQGGQVVCRPEARHVFKAACEGLGQDENSIVQTSMILREPGQPIEHFIQHLIRQLEQTPRS